MTSYNLHVQERTTVVIKAIFHVQYLPSQSNDAVQLGHHANSHSIELIWEKLTHSDLARLNSTPRTAVIDRNWTNTLQEQRHLSTRFVIHGFHYKICETKLFHNPNEHCICELCGQNCERYYLIKCPLRTKPLCEYSEICKGFTLTLNWYSAVATYKKS